MLQGQLLKVILKYNGRRSFTNAPTFQQLRQPASQEQISRKSNVSRARWAVCTTVHSPTQAIMDFFESEDWAIVVVGDEGMEEFQVNATNAVFLDAAAQHALEQDGALSQPFAMASLRAENFGISVRHLAWCRAHLGL